MVILPGCGGRENKSPVMRETTFCSWMEDMDSNGTLDYCKMVMVEYGDGSSYFERMFYGRGDGKKFYRLNVTPVGNDGMVRKSYTAAEFPSEPSLINGEWSCELK
tara:strand:- start:65 stop:379 length:315 start_codon:yes stop_codon:yes gene_type:complete